MTDATRWTLEHIRQHIEAGLPLVPLFNLVTEAAEPGRAVLRLDEARHVTRPGGSVAGPVQCALADVATYALILAARHDPAAVTVDLTIHFLRPARSLPLLAEAVPLRAGRRLFTAQVRITEADGGLVAQAVTTWALS